MLKRIVFVITIITGLPVQAANQYGQLPVSAELCASVSNSLGLEVGSGMDVKLHGKAGGGLRKAADAYVALEVDMTGAFGVSAAIGGSADTETCVDMTSVDIATLSPADLELYNTLMQKFPGISGAVDFNEIGTNVIKNSTALNVSQTQANAGLNVMTAQFDFMDSLLFEPINPINQVNQMISIADHASAILPPRLAKGLRELDQVVIRHLGNIDLVNKSCLDLENGKITHLGAEVTAQIREFCQLAVLFKNDTIGQLQSLVAALNSNKGVAENLTKVVGEINKLQSVGQDISSAVGDVVGFSDQAVSQLLGTIDVITSVGINIEGAINLAEQAVDTSLQGVVTATNVISAASGGILTAAQATNTFMTDTVRPAVDTVKAATTDLVGTVQSSIKTGLCDDGITVGISPATITIKIRDIPVLGPAVCG